MKKGIRFVFLAAVLFAAGVLTAQEVNYNTAAAWNNNAAVTEADGALLVKTIRDAKGLKGVLMVGPKFTIDTTKKYTLKLSAKAVNAQGDDKSYVFAGFNVFDKNGRSLGSHHVNVQPGTLTEIAADAEKGAKVITVKDGSKFRKDNKVLVRDAKEDLSDLPNNKIIGDVKGIEQKGDVWEITLARPINAPLAAGTVVREHSRAGYIYTAGAKRVGADWSVLQGKITGVKPGAWVGSAWPTGAVTAQVLILVNWATPKDLDTEFKDITLTVE